MTNTIAIVLFCALLLLWILVDALKSQKERERTVDERLRALSGKAGKAPKSNRELVELLKAPETSGGLAGALAGAALGWFLGLEWWISAALVPVLGLCAWWAVRRWRIAKAKTAFMQRFPEAVDSFTRAVQAGIPVDRALDALGEAYDDELGRRFTRLVKEMNVGLPFRAALKNFRANLNNPDVDFFCEVLALNRETGTALSPMLQALSDLLRERRGLDRKLKSLTAESRASARVLCLLPIFILGLQVFLNPKHAMFLVTDPVGRIVTGVCASLMIAGFIVIQRMSRGLGD